MESLFVKFWFAILGVVAVARIEAFNPIRCLDFLATTASRIDSLTRDCMLGTVEPLPTPMNDWKSPIDQAPVASTPVGLAGSSSSDATTPEAYILIVDNGPKPTPQSTDSRHDADRDDSPSVDTTIICVGALMPVVFIGVFAVGYNCGRRRERKPMDMISSDVTHDMMEQQRSPTCGNYTAHDLDNHTDSTKPTTGSPHERRRGQQQAHLWEDPLILTARISRDLIAHGPLISRGGYGEVYVGVYNNEVVAIKQLLPERRRDLAQITAFLAEVKLMSALDHQHIVHLIGVAWNSLNDICAVVEYMENGDLRSVIAEWEKERRLNRFDVDKARIALHVAHALTYLHSLQSRVVHRDLKSKNILLSDNFDAKLTDFGVSRERADSTMTAGVGSSLWMAPEVMMGERYDEKADIFSFGVVLSEMDTHQLPYAHAKVNQKIPDAAILQMVSLGRLTVKFTESADPSLVRLGLECVSLDPKKRPTASEVLYRVHQLYRLST